MEDNKINSLFQYMELLEYNIMAYGNFNSNRRKDMIKKLKRLTILAIKSGLDIDKILKEIGILKKIEDNEKDYLKKDIIKEKDDIDEICNSLYKNDLNDKIINFIKKQKSKIYERDNKQSNQEEQKVLNKQMLNKKRNKKNY
jgi:hypothetical protein